MPLARRELTVTDEHGNIVTDAQVEVRKEIAGQPLASIYSDRDGLVPLGNPFSVDPDTGVASFHAVGGAYRVRAFRAGFERVERYVGIGTAAETDAGSIIVPELPTAWLYDTTTADADPGSGTFRLNNATPASATAIYIDNENVGGNDVSAWLNTFDDGGDSGLRGLLTIFDPDQLTEVFRIYAVSGSVVNGTGYRKLTVSHVAGAGSLTAAASYSFAFAPRGLQGDVAGPASSTDGELVRFSGTSGKLLKGTGASTLASVLVLTPGNSTAGLDWFTLKPSDFGTDKPQFVIKKEADAQTYSIVLWDGTDVGGTIDFKSQPTHNSNNLLSTATGVAQGKHTIWIPATACKARVTNGAGTTDYDSGSNDITLSTFGFDTTAGEFIHSLPIGMPKSWNEGTVTAQVYWTNTGGSSTQTVRWTVAGVAFSDDDTLNAAFGTAVNIDDTWVAQNDLHITSESGAITIGGSPAESDLVVFQIGRDVANDNMSGDALFIGMKLFITTNASTDA